mmetsp:Transcript_9047/g.15297  ORF Transcript_9047/g.15297 Transcript_9047/m.15297 type:complete len:853 (-) Transcript_9047:247-2805(-)|eukprot:CAMPEP_0114436720 /NCGR_PEP_ID=MMETSP0103-20121206/13612_1 /TAXON_ID=37642 ORGANISM="Paraphysomonas imperforata, Strain PA2" /NCGR_SAMPLE_ID=MMETSP0103 /ASSEMBLY_ACC=CAM_ASM_000201 /LENGTH=852 /DNA_ID=CAMNT_0001607027 /DNA_START=64 /DNA_END=2622 /DNA_ORIENTATION=-
MNNNRVLPVSGSESIDEKSASRTETMGEEDTETKRRDVLRKLALENTFATRMAGWCAMITVDNFRRLAIWFLDFASLKMSLSFDDLMMILTFFVLFADDIRLLSAPKSVDPGFQVVNSICLFFFIFELVLTTWAKTRIPSWSPFVMRGYMFSFFFFLDLIAILSMLPDINWIAKGLGINGISESVSSTNSNFSKAGRVVRTVRLARLVRIYKIQAERARVKRIEDEQMELVRQGLLTFEDIEKTKQLNETRNSKVGAELSDTTTRRVIVIVLLMLCLVPILNFSVVDEAQPFSVDTLHHFNIYGNDAGRQATLDDFNQQYSTLVGEPYIIKLYMQPFKTGSPHFESRHELYTLRETAITKEERNSTINGQVYHTEVWFNNNSVLEEVALNGILTTLFVSLVMLTGTVVFNADVQNLVLKPIERMMNMVEQVSKDPLQPLYFDHTSGSGEYETRLLEGTIEKITSLLRVGFGEAGAGIISANLNLEDNTSVINPLIPGVRIYAIFGFCDIHHFEDINEKLGKDIMTFVNTIAAIVHNYVHDWKGQCNKNLGNAFLVVWRIGDEHTLQNILSANAGADRQTMVNGVAKKRKAHAIDLRRVPGVDAMADMAIIAYLKIVAELNRSKEILAYRSEPRLTNNGTTNYQVSMGFGLHAGWGIEGAVGSLQKVDATYLSPHVNMSARLESSSRQYGTPLLVSQNFFDLMSVEGQSKCRRLDVVTVKGSEVPIGIYTYDCLQDQLFRSKRHHKRSADNTGTDFYDSSADLVEVFEKDYDLITLRKHITVDFATQFKLGVDTYLQGDWPVARKHLETANELMAQVPSKTGDGPSLTLLRYMEAHGWQAPSSWKGFRPLTSK